MLIHLRLPAPSQKGVGEADAAACFTTIKTTTIKG
jgi:hypothetical protein